MANMHPILIVDDDLPLRTSLAEQMHDNNEFAILEAGSIAEAEQVLSVTDKRIHAIILDVGLPDGDGRTFCAHLRQRGHAIPIIMLTGSTDEKDVVQGFESGADDYVAKPFRLAELMARLRTHLNNYENSDRAVLQIGPYTLSNVNRQLQWPDNSKRIYLTNKEAEILKFLYRAGGEAVERQVLLNEVWGYNPTATSHTLETHVYRLRQKIEPEPTQPRLLVTDGGGYRLAK